jgi:hypothetical protein
MLGYRQESVRGRALRVPSATAADIAALSVSSAL